MSLPDLSYFSDFLHYKDYRLNPEIYPDKQKLLIDHIFGGKDGSLGVRCDLKGQLGQAIAEFYPLSWNCVDIDDLLPGDPPTDMHILSDDELFWLLGDMVWFSTGLRADNKLRMTNVAYFVKFRKGRFLNEAVVRRYLPAAGPLLAKEDFNLLRYEETFGYSIVESDGELAKFLKTYTLILEGCTMEDVPWG